MPTIAALRAAQNYLTTYALAGVWDVNLLEEVAMEQPTIEGETINVAISGPLAVTNANLDAALSTLGTQTTLAQIKAKTDNIPALGQAVAGASSPVVLTAAQISTLTPPAAIAGFALEAGHLATIDTSTAKIPPQGQALAAASMPVVLPAAQITTLTPPAALTNYAAETGGNLASLVAKDFATTAKQDTGNASLATLVTQTDAVETNTAPLITAQGADGTSVAGPLVQGLVNDTPNSYTVGTVQPLSLTAEGRVRVSAVESDLNRIWNHTFESPWPSDNAWEIESLYV